MKKLAIGAGLALLLLLSWPIASQTATVLFKEQVKLPSQVIWEDVDVSDEFVFFLPPQTGTMERIDCRAVGGTSFTIKICDGVDVGNDTCTTNILDSTETTTLTCTTGGASDTALNAAGFSPRDPVTLVITAESGVVDQGIVYITSKID